MADKLILLFGATGQLGSALYPMLAEFSDVVAPERKEVDYTKPRSLTSIIRESAPALIINAAAYTAVDAAEDDESRAKAVNTDGPAILAEEAARRNIPIVHFSTDFVFDGRTNRPYLESDQTAPLNAYGRTKRDGEIAIRDSGAAHFIFRTSWIYARNGMNFLRTMERLFDERDEVTIVADQVGTPTWARSLAEATVSIIRLGADNPEFYIEKSGTYHMTGGGQTSWHGLASAYFVARQNQGACFRCKAVKPISSDNYPTAAQRPAYSVLDSSKLERAFNVVLPNWEVQLSQFMGDPSP